MRLLFFLCRTAVPHSFGIWTSSFGISNFFINRLVFQISATWISNFGFSNFSGHRWIFPNFYHFPKFRFPKFCPLPPPPKFHRKIRGCWSFVNAYLAHLCNLYIPLFTLNFFCPSGTMHHIHNLRAHVVHRP